MPNAISLKSAAPFLLSEARQAKIEDVRKVDFSITADVESARQNIMHMGIWDRFIDRCLHHSAKQDALRAIADKVIADQHVLWAVDAGKSDHEVFRLKLKQHAAHVNFATLLTDVGADAVLAVPTEVSEYGVRFKPATDYDAVNQALGDVILPHDEVLKFLPHRAVPVAQLYAQAGLTASEHGEKAVLYDREAEAWLQAKQYRVASERWSKAAAEYAAYASRYTGRFSTVTFAEREAALQSMREAMRMQGYATAEEQKEAWQSMPKTLRQYV